MKYLVKGNGSTLYFEKPVLLHWEVELTLKEIQDYSEGDKPRAVSSSGWRFENGELITTNLDFCARLTTVQDCGGPVVVHPTIGALSIADFLTAISSEQ